MDVPPTRSQHRLLFGNDLQGTANFGAGHAASPYQAGFIASAEQIDLLLSITENVNMSRRVVVNENYHSKAMHTENRDHTHNNPS